MSGEGGREGDGSVCKSSVTSTSYVPTCGVWRLRREGGR